MNDLYHMKWEALPDNVLLRVFNLLEESDMVHASSTCQRWRRMFYEPRFWRSVTFDFNHSVQSPVNIEMKIRNHLQVIGSWVRHVTIVCPDAGFVQQQIADRVKVTLDTLAESNRTIQSLHLKQLNMGSLWKNSDYINCDLIVSLCHFIESQTCLQNLVLSEARLPTTFGHMVMSSLARSPSVDTLQQLDIFFLYVSENLDWKKKNGNLIRWVFSKLTKLREIRVNYSFLKAIRVEQMCTILKHSLEKLEIKGSRATDEISRFEQIYLDDFNEGEEGHLANDYDDDASDITIDNWTQASRECPNLKVSMDVHVQFDNLEHLLLPTIPVAHLTIRGINSDCDDGEINIEDVLSGRFFKNLETVNLLGEADQYDLELILQADPARIATSMMSFPRLRSVQISSGLISYALLERVKSELRARYGVDREMLIII